MFKRCYLKYTELDENLLSGTNQKNCKIFNPKTDDTIFGKIPENPTGIPSGLIYLRLGYIGNGYKKQGAFGARHIWDKHKVDLGLNSPTELPFKISSILTEGVDVLYEEIHKPVVLNTLHGLVSLQLKQSADGIKEYSIISAYYKTQAKGTVFCKLEMP